MLSNSKDSLRMKKNGALLWLLIILLAVHIFSAYCEVSEEDWVSIDCGNDDIFLDDRLIVWDTDDLYTDAGINQRVRVSEDQSLEIMDTLRSFPSQSEQICYKLSIYQQKIRYLVKSGFLYGDYDGLNQPPKFDLLLDGKRLSTIEIASATEVIIDELVYTSEVAGVIRLCLVRRKDGGVPFISSIQAVPMDDRLYSKMLMNETFRLVARISYGTDDGGIFGPSGDDVYERLWTSGTTPPNCHNVLTNGDFESPANDPPSFVLTDAIESDDASSPIVLTVDLPETSPQPQSVYVVLYFTETLFDDDNRTINILINGQNISTVRTDTTKCTVITLYPVEVKESTVNVTLVAANSTGSPPLINAMEVFSKITASPNGGNPPVHFTFLSFILMLSAYILANLL